MKNTFLNFCLIAVAALLSILTYSSLSSEIAIHWVNGEITNTASKSIGVLLMPVTMILIYGVLGFLFKLDSKKENMSNNIREIIITTVLLLLLTIHIAILAIGLGYALNIEIVSGLTAGLMIMIISNIMPKVKTNFIFGLRTPWTLKNKKVWDISNRIAGRLFFLAGFLIILSVMIIPEHTMTFSIVLVISIAIFGTIHSYIVYKKVIENDN